MDSLTQITLGAAVGEALLGRKIGNRAMLWGAVGGTIPDLDIIGNLFLDPIPSLAFHRGITHSLFFAALLPVPLGWAVFKLYERGVYQKRGYKLLVSLFNVALLFAILTGLFFAFNKSWIALTVLLGVGGILLWRLFRHYYAADLCQVNVTFKDWYVLFFLALATHILLDCFTAFGTQVFLPFSDYRVAFNTIAVVDPLYTVPFILCICIASSIKTSGVARSYWNWAGILISSAYMAFTVINKLSVDEIFQRALDNRQLEVTKCRTSPVIFTNFLWNCTAINDSVAYTGLYSNFDSDPNLHYINTLPLNREVAAPIADTEEYHTLQWFSDQYLLHRSIDTTIVLSDIRFGGMRDTISSYKDLVFNFHATRQPDGSWQFTETRERPDDIGLAFRHLWERIKGR